MNSMLGYNIINIMQYLNTLVCTIVHIKQIITLTKLYTYRFSERMFQNIPVIKLKFLSLICTFNMYYRLCAQDLLYCAFQSQQAYHALHTVQQALIFESTGYSENGQEIVQFKNVEMVLLQAAYSDLSSLKLCVASHNSRIN